MHVIMQLTIHALTKSLELLLCLYGDWDITWPYLYNQTLSQLASLSLSLGGGHCYLPLHVGSPTPGVSYIDWEQSGLGSCDVTCQPDETLLVWQWMGEQVSGANSHNTIRQLQAPLLPLYRWIVSVYCYGNTARATVWRRWQLTYANPIWLLWVVRGASLPACHANCHRSTGRRNAVFLITDVNWSISFWCQTRYILGWSGGKDKLVDWQLTFWSQSPPILSLLSPNQCTLPPYITKIRPHTGTTPVQSLSPVGYIGNIIFTLSQLVWSLLSASDVAVYMQLQIIIKILI